MANQNRQTENQDQAEAEEQTTISSDKRRDLIIEALREQDSVTVTDLSKRLGVTEVTTRKDLQLLEEQNVAVFRVLNIKRCRVQPGLGQLLPGE